jgi:hypothetical protein
VLLTRSRLCPRASPGSSLHLHVLSTPPAFVLSQDQTLREELLGTGPEAHTRHVELSWTLCGAEYTVAPRSMTGQSQVRRARLGSADRTWTHTRVGIRPKVRMLLSFQRPPRPVGKGTPSQETRPDARSDRRGPPSIARHRRSLQEVPTCWAPPERPRNCSASQDRTWTETIRSRGRSSKSTRTTCCQVPRPSSPPTIGIVSLGPITAARRWLWAFVSWLSSLWR